MAGIWQNGFSSCHTAENPTWHRSDMGILMTVSWTKERDEKGMGQEGETEIKIRRGQWRGKEIGIFPLFLTGHLLTQYFI